MSIVDPLNADELAKISKLITDNFLQRSEYRALPKDILDIYCQANTPDELYKTLTKPETFACVVKVDEVTTGVIVCRVSRGSDITTNVQIRRLHAALNSEVSGVGKALLSAAAFMARDNGIYVLSTTASLPARTYFEHLGWQGNLITTKYSLKSENLHVQLPQFLCYFDILDDFQGF